MINVSVRGSLASMSPGTQAITPYPEAETLSAHVAVSQSRRDRIEIILVSCCTPSLGFVSLRGFRLLHHLATHHFVVLFYSITWRRLIMLLYFTSSLGNVSLCGFLRLNHTWSRLTMLLYFKSSLCVVLLCGFILIHHLASSHYVVFFDSIFSLCGTWCCLAM